MDRKCVAYYSCELAAVQERLTGVNIPEARTLLEKVNKLQKEMRRLEDSISSRNPKISLVPNFGRRRDLRRLAEEHIDATKQKLLDFAALCDGALHGSLEKPQKLETLKTVEEGGRRIVDLFQKRNLNLIGVVGPMDVGKMEVVKEVVPLMSKDQKFCHNVVWVDLGVRCDSIKKARKEIRNALETQRVPMINHLDRQSALELLVSLNVSEDILAKEKDLLNKGSMNYAMDPDGAVEKMLKTLNTTMDVIKAGQLMRKLIDLGPTLVILNDVWFSLEVLEMVGIPKRKDCRVMVVSHLRSVCQEMKCQAIVTLQRPEVSHSLLNIKMGIVQNINGFNDVTHEVYKHLSQDAKSILFVYHLFPPCHGIPIEDLTRLAVASQILQKRSDLLAATKRIESIAAELSKSDLLLYADQQQPVLMIPEAVHTCALQIIPPQYFLLLADIDQTLFEILRHSSIRHLNVGGNIQSLEGIQSLSKTLQALRMEPCKLLNSNNDPIKLIGQLTQLETLSFSGFDIQYLPMELGSLEKLKLMDLSDCTDLQCIPAKLIPNWRNLKELYIADFKKWSEDLDHASIDEVLKLPCLSTLFLTATNKQLPTDFSISTKFQRYHIVINGSTNHTEEYPIPRDSSTAISISAYQVQPLCNELFQKLEYLMLKDIAGIQSIIRDQSLPALKLLIIDDCKDLEYIFDGTTTTSVLSNLRALVLINLKKLKCLVKMSSSLKLEFKLETLIVQYCTCLEQIFMWEQPSTQPSQVQTTELKGLTMSFLRKLRVEKCPKLESSDLMLPSTEAQEMRDATLETLILYGEFKERVEKPRDLSIGNFIPFKFRPGYLYTNLKHLELEDLPLVHLWKEQTQIIVLQTLTDLRVINCKELRYIFTATISRNMPQLRNLRINGCHKLEQIIEADEMFSSSDTQRISCFPNLTDLEVSGCPKLTTIFPINIAHFPNLKALSIESSRKLKCVFQVKLKPDHDTSKNEIIMQLP